MFADFYYFSCNKEENYFYKTCGYEDDFKAESTLNGDTLWTAIHCILSKEKNGTFNIEMTIYNDYCELREKLLINDFKLELGKNSLDSLKGVLFVTLIGDGDLIAGVHLLSNNEGFDNYINITNISSDTTEVYGEFQFYLILIDQEESDEFVTKPDTLIFTDGTFSARTI